MKAAIIGVATTMIILVTCIIIMSVSGRDARRSELEESLTNAIEQTMQVSYLEKTYSIKNEEELIADFTGNFFSQIASDSDISIEILNVDFNNGCMDVQATEKFKYFTGKTGEIKIRKTVIFEQYSDPNDKFYKVTFLNADGSTYKILQVYNEGRLSAPEPPKNLIRWKQLDDNTWNGDFSKIIVTQDITFQAICS